MINYDINLRYHNIFLREILDMRIFNKNSKFDINSVTKQFNGI